MAPEYVEQQEPFVPDQNWLVLSGVGTILSFVPLPTRQQHLVPLPTRHEVLVRNTELPASKEKSRCSLSTLMLSDLVIAPGFLLWVNPRGRVTRGGYC